MITGNELFNGPWHQVPDLLKEIDDFYANNPTIPQWEITAKKIVERRGWGPVSDLMKKNLIPVVKELGIRYIPKQMKLGPGILFPIYDHNRIPKHARFNAFYELKSKNGLMKYALLGKEKNNQNPKLFGQTPQVILTMLRSKLVIFVEGYYDLLACRMLQPAAAVLSTGTKTINPRQVWFTQIAGIQKLCLMFDQDSNSSLEEGAGRAATRKLLQVLPEKHGIDVQDIWKVTGQADDPSDALKHWSTAQNLKTALTDIFDLSKNDARVDIYQ